MKIRAYDYIILGGGAAGLVAAKLARGFGKSVLIIEKNKLGGECTLTGCVPSKALIHIAQTVSEHNKLTEHNIVASNSNIDGARVMDYVRKKIEQVASTHSAKHLKEIGIDVVFGSPRFENKSTLICNDMLYEAKKVLIATGSSPFIPSIEGLDTVEYLTNENIFHLPTVPTSLLIIGGGAIGVELGSALQQLGCAVTVIERGSRILAHDDQELATMAHAQLEAQGVKILLNATVTKVEAGVTVTYKMERGEQKITAEKILVAAGRKPNVDEMDLEKIGVVVDENGIRVNAYQQTAVKNIFASGDVAGPYLFSHMAEKQAVIATRNAFIPFKKRIDYRQLCWVTFAGPELAAAGLTEQQAREEFGDKVYLYEVDYPTIDRPMVDDVQHGKAKFICDARGKMLGVHILGTRAGELLHQVQVARMNDIPLSKLDSMIHAYPTYSDVIKRAARRCYVDVLQRKWYVRLAKAIVSRFK